MKLPAVAAAALAAVLLHGAAEAAPGREPSSFLRVLDSVSEQLDPDAPPAPGEAADPGSFRARRPTVPLTRLTTTGNVRYLAMGGGTVIDDEMFRGAVGYADLWSHVVGADINLNINIIPFLSVFVSVGFEYYLGSGAHPYGEAGTGSEGVWEADTGFAVPAMAGLKVNIPFLEPPAHWFHPQTSMASGPLARIRLAGGFRALSEVGILVTGGSKASSDPYRLWEGWNLPFTWYAGMGLEYRLDERLTLFLEVGLQGFTAPEDSGDLATLLKNPGSQDSENFLFFPLLLGISYGF